MIGLHYNNVTNVHYCVLNAQHFENIGTWYSSRHTFINKKTTFSFSAFSTLIFFTHIWLPWAIVADIFIYSPSVKSDIAQLATNWARCTPVFVSLRTAKQPFGSCICLHYNPSTEWDAQSEMHRVHLLSLTSQCKQNVAVNDEACRSSWEALIH